MLANFRKELMEYGVGKFETVVVEEFKKQDWQIGGKWGREIKSMQKLEKGNRNE